MNEYELVRKTKNGEYNYMSELISLYYDDVYRFCCYKTGNSILAYDLTQETFLRFVSGFDNYKEKGQCKPYLFRIAVNTTCDYYRNAHRHIDNEAISDTLLEVAADNDLSDKLVTGDAVRRAIMKLSPYQRDVIILRFYQEFKLSTIAKILSIPLPTAKSRLRQAKEKLIQYLSEEGLP